MVCMIAPNFVSLADVSQTELHIWSLSESKLVASVHVLIEKQDEFIGVSRQIRKRLHHFGIHSRYS